jgi:hypothetical protein
MESWGGYLEGLSKVGSLSVWYLSVGTFLFPDLRSHGHRLWNMLERGFPFCELFDENRDLVKGLEPYKFRLEDPRLVREKKLIAEYLNRPRNYPRSHSASMRTGFWGKVIRKIEG